MLARREEGDSANYHCFFSESEALLALVLELGVFLQPEGRRLRRIVGLAPLANSESNRMEVTWSTESTGRE